LGTAEKLEKVLGIIETWHAKADVLCVVSALSSHTKSEGTTSRLLAAADNAIVRRPACWRHFSTSRCCSCAIAAVRRPARAILLPINLPDEPICLCCIEYPPAPRNGLITCQLLVWAFLPVAYRPHCPHPQNQKDNYSAFLDAIEDTHVRRQFPALPCPTLPCLALTLPHLASPLP